MLERVLKHVPNQRDTGQLIGAVHVLLGRTTFYISILNFFMLIVTAYYTTIRNLVSIPFIWFVLSMLVVILIAMVLEYVVILPSTIIFNNVQAYKHENPFKDDIKLILNRLDDIEDKLNRR